MRTRQDVIRDKCISNQLDGLSLTAKCLGNTANFYIRNVMTGIQKSPDKRTDKENEVLGVVMEYTLKANKDKEARFSKAIAEGLRIGGLAGHVFIKKHIPGFFSLPTADKWFIGYYQLEAILRLSKNVHYLKLPSHVSQNVIRKVCDSWKSYFKALKRYAENPSLFTGKPRMPGYNRTKHGLLWYSNQVSKFMFLGDENPKAYLSLNKVDRIVRLGPADRLPGGKYTKTEIKYAHGRYILFITFDDGAKTLQKPSGKVRMLGIDVGIDNIMSCLGNYPMVPFIVSGLSVKSLNRYFNKRKSQLTSLLTKGKDPKSSVKCSHALDTLSFKREQFLRDFMYKACHKVCRAAARDNVRVVVIGHNVGQKQEVSLGRAVNQSFVSIPFYKLVSTLKTVAEKYGIFVIDREESYTSKASLFDMDDIPVYGDGQSAKHSFSGKRIHRGLYRASNGRAVNADINGAGNILRKEFPSAFEDKPIWMFGTVGVFGFNSLYPNCRKNSSAKIKKQKWYAAHVSKVRYRKRKRRKPQGLAA